ncbi:ATP-binding protein [Nitrosomonas ureae]|uniref:ATPase family associated with various cellular activities (AAA) n=1 Tax=Nitrosomonas ureae TaxID=44577 RepID=A0A1H9D0F2_9PROT|nr:ATP-binding protein [Nitrosomonas ureae]SEQ06966.1 ATPase family associated with various cellular activities (AAA) [Nitrosomonas ureae]
MNHQVSIFEHVPRNLQGHSLLHFYAAVHCLLHYIRRLNGIVGKELETTFKEYPFLSNYRAEIQQYVPETVHWEQAAIWWEREITTWEQKCVEHLPLRAVGDISNASFASRIALVIVGLVDEDSRFGTLFAHLQAPLNYRRPCLEIVGQMLANNSIEGWNICQPLLNGFVTIPNRDAPRSEWVLRIPALLWNVIKGMERLHGSSWYQVHQQEKLPKIQELIFSGEYLHQLEQAALLITQGKIKAIVLRGMQGSERLDVISAIAGKLGYGVIEISFPTVKTKDEHENNESRFENLGPLCTLSHCMPVFTYDLGPGETADLQVLPCYNGPIGVLLGLEGGLRGALAEQALSLTIPMTDADLRLRHWSKTLNDHAGMDLREISERFQIPGAYIRQAGNIAITNAALEQRERIDINDIRLACRTLNRQVLDSLATRLEVEGSWEQLVVSDPVAVKLRELELRCRHRERLAERLGPAFRSTSNRGVRALLTGNSGTGKTFAAKILAAELGMDLYRVDLSAIINKYIGETEKNLHRVLSRAEELDVILLLDEGDSLLGNRTEVKSSNDRYANLETNYLLQRLENYNGIVVVTTNASQSIDNAFQRRMDIVINFTPPQAEERLRIWQFHLPVNHGVDDNHLETIATRFPLSGGQIRNAALHATLLALDDFSQAVRHYHIDAAIESEYSKAGALFPTTEINNRIIDRHSGMVAFIDLLAN